MWIRSQCGNILMDCDSFAIEEHGVKYEVITLSGKSGISISLGTYTTKGKALKVLDEIQNAVENTNYYNIDNFSLGTYALKRGHQVYEMPADEEVKA